jgi:hypothetical protein
MKKIILFSILFGNYCLLRTADSNNTLEAIKKTLEDQEIECNQLDLANDKLTGWCKEKNKDGNPQYTEVSNLNLNNLNSLYFDKSSNQLKQQ